MGKKRKDEGEKGGGKESKKQAALGLGTGDGGRSERPKDSALCPSSWALCCRK